MKDTEGRNASSGEVWLYDPDLNFLKKWDVNELVCLEHESKDGLVASVNGVRHGILVPVSVNLMEKAGTYHFVLHFKDNHADKYKDHQVKPALEVNTSKNIEAIDLKIKDLDDSKEENPGAFICVNDDDDNRNRILDKNESGTVNNENDLVSLRIFLRLRNPTSGTLTLEAVSGGDKIKIWTDSKKGTEVVLPKTWQVGKDAVPNILYVEGISASGSVRDVALQLRYTKDGTTQSDLVRITVVSITLTSHAAHDIPGEGRIDLKHFVTPKYDAEIAAWGNRQNPGDPVITEDKVTLIANITPNHQEVRDRIDWEGAKQDAQDRLKATVTKDNAKKVVVAVKLEGHPCKEASVWVVWRTFSSTDIPIESGATLVTTGDGTTGLGIFIRGGYYFTFTIQPQTIITDTDRPNLSGANTAAVPGATKTHVVSGRTLAGGANLKWDESRQVRVKILNPHLYTVNQLPRVDGHLWSGQPAAETIPEDYPTHPAEGNGDTHTGDEDNNPYDARIGHWLE